MSEQVKKENADAPAPQVNEENAANTEIHLSEKDLESVSGGGSYGDDGSSGG